MDADSLSFRHDGATVRAWPTQVEAIRRWTFSKARSRCPRTKHERLALVAYTHLLKTPTNTHLARVDNDFRGGCWKSGPRRSTGRSEFERTHACRQPDFAHQSCSSPTNSTATSSDRRGGQTPANSSLACGLWAALGRVEWSPSTQAGAAALITLLPWRFETAGSPAKDQVLGPSECTYRPGKPAVDRTTGSTCSRTPEFVWPVAALAHTPSAGGGGPGRSRPTSDGATAASHPPGGSRRPISTGNSVDSSPFSLPTSGKIVVLRQLGQLVRTVHCRACPRSPKPSPLWSRERVKFVAVDLSSSTQPKPKAACAARLEIRSHSDHDRQGGARNTARPRFRYGHHRRRRQVLRVFVGSGARLAEPLRKAIEDLEAPADALLSNSRAGGSACFEPHRPFAPANTIRIRWPAKPGYEFVILPRFGRLPQESGDFRGDNSSILPARRRIKCKHNHSGGGIVTHFKNILVGIDLVQALRAVRRSLRRPSNRPSNRPCGSPKNRKLGSRSLRRWKCRSRICTCPTTSWRYPGRLRHGGTAVLNDLVERAAAPGISAASKIAVGTGWMELFARCSRAATIWCRRLSRRGDDRAAVFRQHRTKLLHNCPCAVWVLTRDSAVAARTLVGSDFSGVHDEAWWWFFFENFVGATN